MSIETFYHLKAHTISNKLVSKVSAQKKGGKVMTAQVCVQILVVTGAVPPIVGNIAAAMTAVSGLPTKAIQDLEGLGQDSISSVS